MTDLSTPQPVGDLAPKAPARLRFVTAAALFDGHDAAINIVRRVLQTSGVEVIHLGHNRGVDEVARAALDEDADAIAVSSYQGGHIEYFRYLIDCLRARGGERIRVFGGGGGVIVADEIDALERYGVARIYSPQAGQRLGLQGMIDDMVARCREHSPAPALEHGVAVNLDDLRCAEGERAWRTLARFITALESGYVDAAARAALAARAAAVQVPVLGVTGTGGAGKSSLTDELVRRFRLDYGDALPIAVLAVDPSRRKSGGALLGDRIRMNAIGDWGHGPRVFMRSLATREAATEVPDVLPDAIAACKVAGFQLIVVETSGIGQGDAAIVRHAARSLYVMTPEFGAASQLEKIDMLDFADFVAINKFDRSGGADALRDVAKQVQRNREAWSEPPEAMPVFGTIAAHFNDDGVTALYQRIAASLHELGLSQPESGGRLPRVSVRHSSARGAIVPTARVRYLSDVAEAVRRYRGRVEAQATLARERWQLLEARRMVAEAELAAGGTQPRASAPMAADLSRLDALIEARETQLGAREKALLEAWPRTQAAYSGDEHTVTVRGREMRNALTVTTLSGTTMRKVSLPKFVDPGQTLRWLSLENLPGHFPFTAGVFPFKRENEDPTRMFAGEGDPMRTNRRFKLLSKGMPAVRLSTAFDSVTLYGEDPDERPDIFGKVGNSGVSVATLDDMKALYNGFDLCAPNTSVSMTINGPAPTILAMFFNVAIDQALERLAARAAEAGTEPSADERAAARAEALRNVRGTVQADILKEDQGQNTCIFSTEFSLKVMGDIQAYFIEHEVRNFYSVSISGYHIAEAGANPITQLAYTLANGFTYVEAYLARGMPIDAFAPNLSFFFSNGMEPEYTVLGRVARRIWAVALRERYGAGERSQKLKYHVQTSGRSLHAQEIDFNDIRTTLQALIAVYDNCNSLHTNAYDEAITTPTDESVRRALAIQLIINREWGLAKSQNPNQGSFIIEELTDLVEAAVLAEFDRLTERGGVLGAMETGYQRGRIQDESMQYEHRKHDGSYPIVGVNTFIGAHGHEAPPPLELARSTQSEKESQLARLAAFQARHRDEAPAMLARLQQAVIDDDNVFAVLMDAVRVCSLGQITHALFEVGGQYRRTM
ncbi:methylmalonyl-CoA mutase [Paraburkholderia sp. NMBU_R16]|uniref:fused isobutyryl-CoA mutase/GTPase IcmF n=1 Tax=Paraburkholderia sp. NMBU_R16 TaxID=2698676 RepID=UPI001567B21F|nr:fused isobutyryl-CoA mutase/GTPase IcmF [Paraburkholderia sp. NMBU_R16]NRO98603.1 methylmalonyl-CoA mutase [Paraburkholderia sp. NMBU_R16]